MCKYIMVKFFLQNNKEIQFYPLKYVNKNTAEKRLAKIKHSFVSIYMPDKF